MVETGSTVLMEAKLQFNNVIYMHYKCGESNDIIYPTRLAS